MKGTLWLVSATVNMINMEPVDKAFLHQLQKALGSQAFVLLQDFNFPNVCWKRSVVSYRQYRRLLEWSEDKFLSQVKDSPTRRDVILDHFELHTYY